MADMGGNLEDITPYFVNGIEGVSDSPVHMCTVCTLLRNEELKAQCPAQSGQGRAGHGRQVLNWSARQAKEHSRQRRAKGSTCECTFTSTGLFVLPERTPLRSKLHAIACGRAEPVTGERREPRCRLPVAAAATRVEGTGFRGMGHGGRSHGGRQHRRWSHQGAVAVLAGLPDLAVLAPLPLLPVHIRRLCQLSATSPAKVCEAASGYRTRGCLETSNGGHLLL